MDKIELAIESLGFMGSAISKLFSGDFSGALDDAGKGIVGLNRALNPAVIATEALVNSTKELIKEITNSKYNKTIIHTKEKVQEMINIQWILFTLLFLILTEWFIRKYNGLY